MIHIKTERLVLRNVNPEDAAIMYDYRNHPDCSRYQRGQTRDFEGISSLIQLHREDKVSVEDSFLIAVAGKDTDEMIGEIVVMPNDGTISLGYTISYAHHRQGYAYEALYALIELLHKMYPTWDFISFTDPGNLASRMLLEKLGYKNMGYHAKLDSQIYGKWTTSETEAEIRAATNSCQTNKVEGE